MCNFIYCHYLCDGFMFYVVGASIPSLQQSNAFGNVWVTLYTGRPTKSNNIRHRIRFKLQSKDSNIVYINFAHFSIYNPVHQSNGIQLKRIRRSGRRRDVKNYFISNAHRCTGLVWYLLYVGNSIHLIPSSRPNQPKKKRNQRAHTNCVCIDIAAFYIICRWKCEIDCEHKYTVSKTIGRTA